MLVKPSMVSIAALVLLAGCADTATRRNATGTASTSAVRATASPAIAHSRDPACTSGLTGREPGVVSMHCDGTAEVRVHVADISRDIHGGTCTPFGKMWSFGIGLAVDETGSSGKYAGPPFNNIVGGNEAGDIAGKGGIAAILDGKHYFDMGYKAIVEIGPDGKTAHLEGTADADSAVPGAHIEVDVRC